MFQIVVVIIRCGTSIKVSLRFNFILYRLIDFLTDRAEKAINFVGDVYSDPVQSYGNCQKWPFHVAYVVCFSTWK